MFNPNATHVFPLDLKFGLDFIEQKLYNENVYGKMLTGHLSSVMKLMRLSKVLGTIGFLDISGVIGQLSFFDGLPMKHRHGLSSADSMRLDALVSCSFGEGSDCGSQLTHAATSYGMCNVFNGINPRGIYLERM